MVRFLLTTGLPMPALRRHCCLLLAPIALLAACEPPAPPASIGAAEAVPVIVPPPPVADTLPDAVQHTIALLKDISANGTYRDMAELADATPGFRSNNAGMSHRDYWYLKLRTGDWPMEHVGRVLAQPHAVRPTEQGKVYVWPKLATVRGASITPLEARAIDALLGEGQAAAIRDGAPWPGYVLGIAEDGTWLYFVSGEG